MLAKEILLLTIGFWGVAQAASAVAQEAPVGDGQAATSVTQLEEITITARKRQESYLDVPVVANVIGQGTLEGSQLNDLSAVATRVPGLVLSNGIISTGTQISLRGIGTTAINTTMDQSVSLDIDGLSLSQGLAYEAGVFDVAQVTVLKGPQSLFFGKNNTAGTISLTSIDPTDKFEAIIREGYEAESEQSQTDAIVSGPVTDTLKLRLAARYSTQEGFFRDDAVGVPSLGGETPAFHNYAPSQDALIRGTLLFEPNDSFTARLKLNYDNYRMDGGATPFQITYCPGGTSGVPPVNIPFLQGDSCKASRSNMMLPWANPAAYPAGLPNGGEPFEDRTQGFGTLGLTYLPTKDLSLTSMTGFYHNSFYALADGDTTTIADPYMSITHYHDTEFEEEVRLTSDYADSPLNYMVGSFYQYAQERQQLGLPGNVFIGLPAMIQSVLNTVDIHSLSFFGQLRWDIVPKLELAAGARWTDEARTMTEYNFNTAQGPLGYTPLFTPRISATNVSPEVTLTFKPTDTFTVYGAFKTGFKSGSFDAINFVPTTTRNSFKDEKAQGGEVGIKTLVDDRRVAVNVSGYYYRYTNLQVGAQVLSSMPSGQDIVITNTLNAAAALVYGVEFDGNYSPAPIHGLTLTAELAYNHSRYTSFPNAPCGNDQTISQGCNQLYNPTTGLYTAQNLAGQPLVRAPDWAGYVGFEQKTAVSKRGNVLNFGAGVNYTSHYSTVLGDLPGFVQSAYAKVDAHVSLQGSGDRWQDGWEVSLIGLNLTDEITQGSCANNNTRNATVFGGQIAGGVTGGPAGGDDSLCSVGSGREIWGRLSWKF